MRKRDFGQEFFKDSRPEIEIVVPATVLLSNVSGETTF